MTTRKQVKVAQARKFRKEQTKAEEVLWRLLRNKLMLEFKFRRQYIVKGFILDFYCPKAKLGIELDGGVHLKQKDFDSARQQLIEANGIKILRFTNSDVFNKSESVLKTIANNLLADFTALSLKRRGGTPMLVGVGEV